MGFMCVFFVLNQSPRPTRTKPRTNPQHQHLQVSTWIHLNIPTIQLTFHRREEASTKSTRRVAPKEPQKNKTKSWLQLIPGWGGGGDTRLCASFTHAYRQCAWTFNNKILVVQEISFQQTFQFFNKKKSFK